MNITVSPSRTYVAMCSSTNFNRYYFRRFVLPDCYRNDSEQARWYFLNKIDFTACMPEGVCVSFENFADLKDAESTFPEVKADENAKKIVKGIEASINCGEVSLTSGNGLYTFVWTEHKEASSHFIRHSFSVVELEDPRNVPIIIHSFLLSYLDYTRRPR